MSKYLIIFFFQIPLFFAKKELCDGNKIGNDKIVKHINDTLIVNIVEKITNKNLKNVHTCQLGMIALAEFKVGNTSENLFNEIRQIINPLYREKEITKKVYNNIMNSIKL